MKYLKTFEQKTSLIGYHGTSSNKQHTIEKNGLKNPYIAENEDLAFYYAQEAAYEYDGDPIVYEVTIDNISNMRYDGAAMDEPVYADGAGGTEEDASEGFEAASEDHPEWVQNDMIIIPKEYWKYSWDYVRSAWYEGIITPDNLTEI